MSRDHICDFLPDTIGKPDVLANVWQIHKWGMGSTASGVLTLDALDTILINSLPTTVGKKRSDAQDVANGETQPYVECTRHRIQRTLEIALAGIGRKS